MSEERLRELLQKAVPDAPDIDPSVVRGRAAASARTRRWTAVAALAVFAAIAGSATVVALTNDPPAVDVVTAPTPSPTTRGLPSPYDVPTCPALLPRVPAGGQQSLELTDVVGVRSCPDLNPRDDPRWQPSADDVAVLRDADALVFDTERFVSDVRALPPGLPAYCTTQPGSYVRLGLLVAHADGTHAVSTARGCELISVEGRLLDIGAVSDLYTKALERQRDSLDYTRAFDDVLTCTTATRGDLAGPGRERLVAAIACDLPDGAESIPDDLQPVTLDAEQLAELDRAWSDPGAPLTRGPDGSHECLDVTEPPSFIVAATDRSDVVQLVDTPCGFLVWAGSTASTGATIPTTVSALLD